jgi:hypothetical protein
MLLGLKEQFSQLLEILYDSREPDEDNVWESNPKLFELFYETGIKAINENKIWALNELMPYLNKTYNWNLPAGMIIHLTTWIWLLKIPI